MKKLLTFLVLTTTPWICFAETVDAEMHNYQKSLNDAFRDFPDKPAANTQRTGDFNSSPTSGHGKSSNPFTTANFNKAAQTPYAKAQTMKTISDLALAFARSAGSMQGLQSSSQAAQLGSALSASSDPSFKQMGNLLTQESSSIASGDRPTAESFASQIGSMDRPYVPPGYQPTQGEDFLVSAFGLAAGSVFSSLTGVLGAVVVKDLLSGLGIQPSGWSTGLGNSVGSGLGRSAATGQSAQPVLQNGAQSGIAQGAGNLNSAIYQSSGSLLKTNPVGSSQTGSAPSAGN